MFVKEAISVLLTWSRVVLLKIVSSDDLTKCIKFGIQIVWFLDDSWYASDELQLWKLLNKIQYRYWTLHFKCNSFIPLDVKRTKNLRWFSFLPEYSNSFMQKPKERKQKSQHTISRPQGLIWCIPLTIEKSFFYCRRQIFFV